MNSHSLNGSIVQKPKVKTSSETQGKHFAVSPCKDIKKVTDSQDIIAQNNISIPKGKTRRIAKKDWTKIRLKLSTMLGIQATWCCDMNNTRLGQPNLLAICSSHDLSLRLTPLIAYSFLPQTFHIPNISNILRSPLEPRLHLHSFIHCPPKALPTGILTVFLYFLLKSGWKYPWM
jgi:hypothetical protein